MTATHTDNRTELDTALLKSVGFISNVLVYFRNGQGTTFLLKDKRLPGKGRGTFNFTGSKQ